MAVDVVMPQMGESIAEGTIIRWMKKVGERVERDEPLFEISTDKVDAEIPSPASGTVAEILAEEGKTVAVNSVVARLAAEGEAAAPSAPEPQPAAAQTPQQTAAQESAAQEIRQDAPAVQPTPAAPVNVAPPQPQQPEMQPAAQQEENVTSLDERRRTRSSPLVRKIAKENDVDISQIEGSGVSGRVTKQDILQYLESPRPAAQAQPASQAQPSAQPSMRETAAPAHAPMFAPGESIKVEPLSVMRKKIADHMIFSKRTSAHVSTVFEVDFTNVDKLRRKYKASYVERGVNLTFMPFIIQAVIAAIREFPILNSSLDGDSIVYKNDINLGIAVALDWGLIVPVLKRADEKNILGIAKAVNDLGTRARSKKLNPDDVQGGTFTITNPGVFGSLFGTPIINQPQVAILGVGTIKKRPVVIETDDGDAIVIRSMAYLALTFDHRLIDGAVADQFMAKIKSVIEDGQFML